MAAPPLWQDIGFLAKVTVNRLIVRTGPSISAPQLFLSGVPVVLNDGDHVLVVSTPHAADGYWWALVALEADPHVGQIPVASVAVGTQADPWLVYDRAPCPHPTVASLGALPGIERIGCPYYPPIEISAHQASEPPEGGLGGLCHPGTQQPGWLVCDTINYNWVNADGGTDWQLLLHFDPASGIAPTGLAPAGTIGPVYDIVGHFEDPASDDCRTADPGSEEAISQYLTCDAKFVVDSLDEVVVD